MDYSFNKTIIKLYAPYSDLLIMKKTPPPSKPKKPITKKPSTTKNKVAATKSEVKAAGDKVMKKYHQAIKGLAKR